MSNTEERCYVSIPKQVVSLLKEVRKGDVMRPSLGQLVTAAVMEKYKEKMGVIEWAS